MNQFVLLKPGHLVNVDLWSEVYQTENGIEAKLKEPINERRVLKFSMDDDEKHEFFDRMRSMNPTHAHKIMPARPKGAPSKVATVGGYSIILQSVAGVTHDVNSKTIRVIYQKYNQYEHMNYSLEIVSGNEKEHLKRLSELNQAIENYKNYYDC